LSNDAWQKEEILAAKLENFLTTVHLYVFVMHAHPIFLVPNVFVCFFFF